MTDKIRRSFFQTVVVSILLYGCTTWMLLEHMEKKLNGNYTKMPRAILNKSWRQHPTKPQLYGHLPPITKTIKIWRTRDAGHCWRSRDDVLVSTPSHGRAKACRPEHTYSSSVPIREVTQRICRKQWTIGMGGKRWSGISVLIAQHDDDDDGIGISQKVNVIWRLKLKHACCDVTVQHVCHCAYKTII